ncbi:MAG: XdhC family protein [Nitrososphaerota archaeon]|nr:XdhC family protein [Nitrososphaerota archaeon]
MDDQFLSKVEEYKNHKLAVATVTKTFGSTLGKPGFKMLITEKGEIIYGTLGGGCPEGPIVKIGLDVIKNQTTRVARVFLEDVKTALGKISVSDDGDEIHVETNCGGNMEILIEPYSPRPTLMVFGDTFNSPLERTLVNVGKEIGFRTVEHNPLGACGNPDLASASLDIDSIKIPDGAYVILVTRGVNDAPLLTHLSKFRLNYIGVVASKNRWSATKKELENSGVSREFIERVHAPAGLELNSYLLEEIAISILAEIIEHRRKPNETRVELRRVVSKSPSVN